MSIMSIFCNGKYGQDFAKEFYCHEDLQKKK